MTDHFVAWMTGISGAALLAILIFGPEHPAVTKSRQIENGTLSCEYGSDRRTIFDRNARGQLFSVGELLDCRQARDIITVYTRDVSGKLIRQ